MTKSSDFDWVSNISKIALDEFFPQETAQIKAKSLLKEITDEIPKFNWTYKAPTILRNMISATFSLQALGEINPKELKNFEKFTLDLARTWESLAELEEQTNYETAILNAAITYELAGYQANSSCLSRQITKDFRKISKPSINEVVNAFIQRLFLQVTFFHKYYPEPEVENTEFDNLWMRTAEAMTIESLAQLSYFFLNGKKTYLTNGFNNLKDCEEIFADNGYVLQANLIRSVRSLLFPIYYRSTWKVFEAYNENPRWKRYMKLLARGTGGNFLESQSISELWPSQIKALENGLLTSNMSKVIRMPTSAGKTRIAELAIVNSLISNPGSKVVYVAPYRALVWELEQDFLNLFGDLGFQVSSFLGSFESDDFETMLASDADILVLTPEKLDLLQRAHTEFLENVRLFVLDEGHIVHDKARGVKFELLLTRLKRKLSNARFLFISAVVPKETLEDFITWFGADPKDDIILSDWRPAKQRYAYFIWQGKKGVIRYAPDEDNSYISEFVPGVISQKVYPSLNPRRRAKPKPFPDQTNKSEIAAELAYKFAELGPVLIFCSEPRSVKSVAKAIELRLKYAKKVNEKIPSFFNTPTNTSAICSKEWLGEEHPTTKFLKNGIAIHHGRLPDLMRKAIESDFRNKKYRILVATNTLGQGVNLPIRTVIIHSCYRYSREYNKMILISARDYWNIAGRAGRAGRETEGTIIHIIRNSADTRAYRYYLKKRIEVEPVRSALFQLLKDLIDKRLSEKALKDKLDSEILALLVEEGTDFFAEKNLEKVLDGTLIKIQSERMKKPIEQLKKVFQTSGEEINEKVSKEYQSVFSSTGLNSESCTKLLTFINENTVRIKHFLKDAGPSELCEMACFFMEPCLSIPKIKPQKELDGVQTKLIQLWINGVTIPKILSQMKDQKTSIEELTKIIDDLFQEKLPWGLSAILQIAIKETRIPMEELSDYAKYLPTMVKYGVSTPQASWALTAGIPFRKTAMEIATKYLKENDTTDREDFIKWLGKIHPEELRYDFGLEGQTLEDVNKVIYRFSSNPLLRKYASSKKIMPHETYVVATSFENRLIPASKAKIGDKIMLIREYDNSVDRNAIGVFLNNESIGYLERQLAQLLAPDIDCGLSLKGTITTIDSGKVPQLKIKIDIN